MHHASWSIELEQKNCGPTYWGQTDNPSGIESEVRSPTLPTRVKQRDHRVTERINSSKIGPFITIARQASQSEISKDRLPAMSSCDDMIHLVTEN
jgi:hypothetical protein